MARPLRVPIPAIAAVILRRRDGIFAYLLAVVIDDAEQGVTHVVRGADLLEETPRQILLQRTLGLPTPSYAHVPVLCEPDGTKLAKSRRAIPVSADGAAANIVQVFEMLGLEPPDALKMAPIRDIWRWGFARWEVSRVPARLQHAVFD